MIPTTKVRHSSTLNLSRICQQQKQNVSKANFTWTLFDDQDHPAFPGMRVAVNQSSSLSQVVSIEGFRSHDTSHHCCKFRQTTRNSHINRYSVVVNMS
jgi:hypothetical protein